MNSRKREKQARTSSNGSALGIADVGAGITEVREVREARYGGPCKNIVGGLDFIQCKTTTTKQMKGFQQKSYMPFKGLLWLL